MKISYNNDRTLLIIDKKGVLRRLFTPFLVKCIQPIEDFTLEEILEVENVLSNEEIPLIYRIRGKLFAHYYFVLV
jgi:hypothetical protein